MAGVPPDLLVEAHGSFGSAHCIDCQSVASLDVVRKAILASEIPYCAQCKKGVVKPDIVFFGESLPRRLVTLLFIDYLKHSVNLNCFLRGLRRNDRFFDLFEKDFPQMDLLLVMGTSLTVQPFASLINHVDDECPRVLFNREKVGVAGQLSLQQLLMGGGGGFVFEGENAYRDTYVGGDLQEQVAKFADLAGLGDELRELMQEYDQKHGTKPPPSTSDSSSKGVETGKKEDDEDDEDDEGKQATSSSKSQATAESQSSKEEEEPPQSSTDKQDVKQEAESKPSESKPSVDVALFCKKRKGRLKYLLFVIVCN